jgi:signal transduction histidine kinase
VPLIVIHIMAFAALYLTGDEKIWTRVLVSLIVLVGVQRLKDKRQAHRLTCLFFLCSHLVGWTFSPKRVSADFAALLGGKDCVTCSSLLDATFWVGHLMLLQCVAVPLEYRTLIYACIAGGMLRILPTQREQYLFAAPFFRAITFSEIIDYQLRLAYANCAAAAERERAKEQELMALVAHETRNPLNGVLGNLRLAAADLMEACAGKGVGPEGTSSTQATTLESARDHVRDAITSSTIALRVLSNMNELGRLHEGLFDPRDSHVELAELLSDVSVVLLPQLREGVELRTVLENVDGAAAGAAQGALPSLPRAVLIDRKILVQILTNLGANAARFTTRGFVEIRLSAAAVFPAEGSQARHHGGGGAPQAEGERRSMCAISFAVRDTGSGISKERQGKLFGRYTTCSGTGLGLYLSQLQVECLGSSIAVNSPWAHGEALGGAGATFSFTLALPAANTTPAPAPDLVPAPLVEKAPRVPPVCFARDARILIADDVRMNRQVLRLMICKVADSWTVIEAETTTAALQLATRSRFDLIIIDEIFGDDPGEERGSDVIVALRAAEREQPPARPAVIVSCTGNEAYEAAALLTKGADAVWPKPVPSATDGSLQRELAKLLPWLVQK